MTPETEVTSTVTSNNSNTSCDSDQSQELPAAASSSSSISNSTPIVIPSSTTIVCLPNNIVTLPKSSIVPATYITNAMPSNVTTQQPQQARQGKIYSKNLQRTIQLTQAPTTLQIGQVKQQLRLQQHQQPPIITLPAGRTVTQPQSQQLQQLQQQQRNHLAKPPQKVQLIQKPVGSNQRATIVTNSGKQYITLPLGQPIRTVTNTVTAQATSNVVVSVKHPKIPTKGGRGSRTNNSNRPPPGAVNLERSYQICQAVIQNSPNRHQLKAQLKPPPSLLASPSPSSNGSNSNSNSNSSNCSNNSNSSSPSSSHSMSKRDTAVTSSNRTTIYKVIIQNKNKNRIRLHGLIIQIEMSISHRR